MTPLTTDQRRRIPERYPVVVRQAMAFARRHKLHPDDCLSAAHEALCEAACRQDDAPAAWAATACTVVRSRLLDLLVKTRRRSCLPLDCEPADYRDGHDRAGEAAESVRLWPQIVGEDAYRTLRRHFFDRVPYRQIAQEQGVTLYAARVAVVRAQARLRARLMEVA